MRSEYYIERVQRTSQDGRYRLSVHASNAIMERGLPQDSVFVVLARGRCTYVRHARVFVVGKKEVKAAADHGEDIRRYLGIHCIVDPSENVVQTVYRNYSRLQTRP